MYYVKQKENNNILIVKEKRIQRIFLIYIFFFTENRGVISMNEQM